MEDIDGGLHPAVDGQSLDEDEDEYTIQTKADEMKTQSQEQTYYQIIENRQIVDFEIT